MESVSGEPLGAYLKRCQLKISFKKSYRRSKADYKGERAWTRATGIGFI